MNVLDVLRWTTSRVVLVLALAVAGLFFTAAPASAAVRYSVNMTQACQEKGHFAASYWNWTAYGWYCYDLSFPALSIAPAGGVDVQAWCSRHYPGSEAKVIENNLWGWRCIRNW